MSAPIGQVEGHSSVELNDSCNCTECCPRVCCFPFGRKIKHQDPRKPVRNDERIDVTATGIKVHTASQPQLTKSGHWEVEIDGRKHDVQGNLIPKELTVSTAEINK